MLSVLRGHLYFSFNHTVATEGFHQQACHVPHSLRQSDVDRDESDWVAVRSRTRERRVLFETSTTAPTCPYINFKNINSVFSLCIALLLNLRSKCDLSCLLEHSLSLLVAYPEKDVHPSFFDVVC